MTDDIWEFEDMYRMMTENAEQRMRREKKERERHNLRMLMVLCAVAFAAVYLVTCGPSDMETESSMGELHGSHHTPNFNNTTNQ